MSIHFIVFEKKKLNIFTQNEICRYVDNIQHSDTMAQQTVNIHSESIDKKIQKIRKGDKYEVPVGPCSHESIIRTFSDCIFTNLVHDTFSRTYMKKYPCSDCAEPSTDRCHGIGEERPILLKKAMERVWPDMTKQIVLKEIVIAFLEEHKSTSFTFKCRQCHKNEKK